MVNSKIEIDWSQLEVFSRFSFLRHFEVRSKNSQTIQRFCETGNYVTNLYKFMVLVEKDVDVNDQINTYLVSVLNNIHPKIGSMTN